LYGETSNGSGSGPLACKKRGIDGEDAAETQMDDGMPSWFRMWSQHNTKHFDNKFVQIDSNITTVLLLAVGTQTALESIKTDVGKQLKDVKKDQGAQAQQMKDLEKRCTANIVARISLDANSNAGTPTRASSKVGSDEDKEESLRTLILKGWQFNVETQQRMADIEHLRSLCRPLVKIGLYELQMNVYLKVASISLVFDGVCSKL
jgi:hypothetical protein